MQFLWVTALCVALVAGQDWQLYWSDEFDGEEIDLTKWQHEVTMWGGGVR